MVPVYPINILPINILTDRPLTSARYWNLKPPLHEN